MAISKLRIGTRGSQLALIQTEMVAAALKARNPGLSCEIKIIITKGDKDLAPIPLDTIGKAWFTKEIEQAILSDEVDLAVHSLKDLPPERPKGLRYAPVLEREDPRDVLVTKTKAKLADLLPNAVIGTDSLRRKAELLHRRPDLIVKSVRGNVETRLSKLKTGDYDGLMLASAGLSRLGLLDQVTEFLDPSEYVPAIGQGVLAVEARQNDVELWDLIRFIQDKLTVLVVKAEQAFSQVIGGGCKLPIGCYVRLEAGKAFIHGMVGSMDAMEVVVKSVSGSEADAVMLAKKLAKDLLKEPFMSSNK